MNAGDGDSMRSRGLYERNNFDLIRLMAASQVALIHLAGHFHYELSWPISLLRFAPGVPIFFFVSGFLIAAAWDRNPDIRTFYRNRAARILPALWASVALGALSVLVLFDAGLLKNWRLYGWVIGQATILQAWN